LAIVDTILQMCSFDETNAAFLQWLKDHGAFISDKIAISDYSAQECGRGVIATQDIEVHNHESLSKTTAFRPLCILG
jgi:hypothetical protein